MKVSVVGEREVSADSWSPLTGVVLRLVCSDDRSEHNYTICNLLILPGRSVHDNSACWSRMCRNKRGRYTQITVKHGHRNSFSRLQPAIITRVEIERIKQKKLLCCLVRPPMYFFLLCLCECQSIPVDLFLMIFQGLQLIPQLLKSVSTTDYFSTSFSNLLSFPLAP